MTKWGMPGVYTHAFMDGWSPGYLGSVAYNHNGLMKMYETQSGATSTRRRPRGRATRRQRHGGRWRRRRLARRSGRRWQRGVAARAPRGGAAAASAASGRRGTARRGAGAGSARRRARRAGAAAHRRCRPAAAARRIASGIAASRCRPNAVASFTPARQHQLHADRRALGAAADGDVPGDRRRELLHQDAQRHRGRAHEGAVRLRDSRAARHDACRRARAGSCACRGSRSATATAEFKIGDATYPAGSYVIKRDQPYGRLAKNLLEKQQYSRHAAHDLRRQRLDDGAADATWR